MKLLDKSSVIEIEEIQSVPFSIAYYTQHFSCNACSSEKYSLNSPKFVVSSNLGVSTYYLPPMSGSELSALALFFTTSASFPCTIIFDHVEGFSVSASVVDNTNVALELKADAQILKFMGIEDSSEVINITLNIQQLDQLARKILHSTTLCN
jgi:hypothetical protein